VNTSDFNKYMDIQQEINFQIYEVFHRMEIGFAMPTQKWIRDERAAKSLEEVEQHA
jgi:hypothetical protein